MEDAMRAAGGKSATQETRRRVEELHLAFVANKEVVAEHAQWRRHWAKAQWDAAHASPHAGPDAAISPSAADRSNKVSGQEPSADGVRLRRAWV